MCGYKKITRKNKTIKPRKIERKQNTCDVNNFSPQDKQFFQKVTRRLYMRETIDQFVDVVSLLYLTFLSAITIYSITHIFCVCNT